MNLSDGAFADDPVLERAYDNDPPLRMGTVGAAVAKIQAALVGAGHPLPRSMTSGLPDGRFGPETERAVVAFQRSQRIRASGSVGRRTLDRLQLGGGPAPVPSAGTPGAPRSDMPGPAGSVRRLSDLLAAPPPEVGSFEALTATTLAEESAGEMERGIGDLWTREHLSFTAAARRMAEGPALAGGGPQPTSSARTGAGALGTRRALNLFAHDYRGTSGDLPGIAEVARAGSPLRRSQDSEFATVDTRLNPTGRDIRAAVYDAVRDAAAASVGSGAELVVYFSGHGGGGGISGVDWDAVEVDELASHGRLASSLGVHLVYVLDTCHAGHLATFANVEAMSDVRGDAARIGPMWAAIVECITVTFRELGIATNAVAGPLHELDWAWDRAERSRLTTSRRRGMRERIGATHTPTTELGELLAQPRLDAALPDRPALEAAAATFRSNLDDVLGVIDGSPVREVSARMEAVKRSGGRLLDGSNDALTHMVGSARRLVDLGHAIETAGSMARVMLLIARALAVVLRGSGQEPSTAPTAAHP